MTREESERIVRWHERCYRRLGLDEGTVATLVSWEVDPHDVDRLLRRGGKPTDCTPEQVLAILQPLDDQAVMLPSTEPELYSVKV